MGSVGTVYVRLTLTIAPLNRECITKLTADVFFPEVQCTEINFSDGRSPFIPNVSAASAFPKLVTDPLSSKPCVSRETFGT